MLAPTGFTNLLARSQPILSSLALDSNMPKAHATTRKLLALAGALSTCALLAACGGSSTDPSSSAAAKASEDAVKFARCMREHGVDVEVSTEGAATRIQSQSGTQRGQGEGGLEPRKLEEAQKDCQRYQPHEGLGRKLSPQERVQQEEAVQKFAKCMREHGVHVEASTSSAPGGGIAVRVGSKAGAGGPNPESPTFQKAQEACQSLLPFKGPKGALRRPPKLPRPRGGGSQHTESTFSAAG